MKQDMHFLEDMLDNMQTGIYILDKDGKYIFLNKASMGKNRYSKKELLGTDVHDLIANKVVDFCVSDIVREKKHAVTIVQQVYSTDGRPAYKQIITSTPIFDAFGEIQYFFTEIANISELNQLYQQALLQEKIQSLTVSTSLREKGKEKIIYQSPVMENLLTLANKICNVDLPVLLFGESGTGKEVLAQYIHKQSNRGQKK